MKKHEQHLKEQVIANYLFLGETYRKLQANYGISFSVDSLMGSGI